MLRTIVIIVCVVILSIGLYIRFNWDKYQMDSICLMYDKFLNESFENSVQRKYEDPNHGMKKKILVNSKEIPVFLDNSGFYDFINPGDSIVKIKGSPEIKVYQDSALINTFKIDFGCLDD